VIRWRPRRSGAIRNRFVGVMLLGAGLVIVVALLLVPIPVFEDLEPRTGTLVEARRDRFSPCRYGDCTRTLVTVRYEDRIREYNFADVDPGTMEEGAPITVWTYPEIRGLDRQRAWHAMQDGRVIRDHGPAAAADRGIRVGLALLPVLVGAGWWITRRYDWQGRRVGAPARSPPRGGA
jgi:hypothetical protein